MLLTARLQALRIAATEVGSNPESVNAQLRRSNSKSLNTFMIITGTLIVTWFPTIIALYPLYFSPNKVISTVLNIFQFSNSWLNTVIYYWRDKTFRNVAKSLVFSKPRTL